MRSPPMPKLAALSGVKFFSQTSLPPPRQPSVIESPRNRTSTSPFLAMARNCSWRSGFFLAGTTAVFLGFSFSARAEAPTKTRAAQAKPKARKRHTNRAIHWHAILLSSAIENNSPDPMVMDAEPVVHDVNRPVRVQNQPASGLQDGSPDPSCIETEGFGLVKRRAGAYQYEILKRLGME